MTFNNRITDLIKLIHRNPQTGNINIPTTKISLILCLYFKQIYTIISHIIGNNYIISAVSIVIMQIFC